jgi:ArsR family transcriptional regulator, arsenate/arsenite/antimonite-responsive transcriptional repressor
MKQLIQIFKVLSDKNRLRILLMLSRKPLCVCEIQDILRITVSTVSRHLSILRDAGFILDEKDGKWVNYKLNIFNDDAIIQQFLLILPMWLHDDEMIKSDYVKVSEVNRNLICGNEKTVNISLAN